MSRDANGSATRISQANGVATAYAYDALNRLVSVARHPDAQTNLTTSYALDGNGQPTSRTAADGVTVSYAYDALSRLTGVSATGLSITYAYDALGRRTQMTDGTGTTTYQYDGLGRLAQVAAPNGTLSYACDRDGNRTALGYSATESVSYAYSPGGRMTTVTDWAGRVSGYAYKPSGLVASLRYPQALLATYAYDRAQRLARITYTLGGTIVDERYALDPEGNRVAIDDFVQGMPATTGRLRYDGLSRLLAFDRQLALDGGQPFTAESFAYDGATNLTSRTGPAATFMIDGANRLTSDGIRAFVWDRADRLVQRGADTFAYDALSRLTSSTVAGVTRTYAYDGDGLLRSRTEGTTTASFLYDPSVAPAPLLQAGAERIVHGLGPLYRVHADGTFDALARDGLGSVRAAVSGTGRLTNAYDYAAYGALRASLGGRPLLGFAGELTDPSGLIYLRARWYDPSSGRFLLSDPISGSQFAPESLNRYMYAAGSPTMRTDSSGLCTDPGGPGVRYCIDRFIPTGSTCIVVIVCFRGDARGPLAESAADSFRVRQVILSDGSVRNVAGTTRLEPFGWPSGVGPLEGCTTQTDPSAIDVACTGRNGVIPAPPIRTRVQITIVNGRVTVSAAGTFYPSLEVWRYGGAGGPQLLYFYDARAAAPFDLFRSGALPNSRTEGK